MSLRCLLLVAVFHCTCVLGQTCDPSALCCRNETCCSNGCCQSNFPICCSQYQSCCPSAFPNCCPNNSCCPQSHPHCCPTRGECCSTASPHCCPGGCCSTASPHCCSNGCCPAAFPVCCTTYCCPSGSYCCGQRQCCSRRSTRAIPLFVPAENDQSTPMFHFAQSIDVVRTEVEAEPEAQYGEASDANQMTRHSIFKRQATVLSGPCNAYKREIENEGYRTLRYFDTEGIPTIGVGHNLNKSSSQQQIENVGADYDEVLNGRQALTKSQIKTLFYMDMRTAVECAMNWLPTWSSLGLGPQSAMADMAFNLGCTRLRRFNCLWRALSRSPPDLQEAIAEMRDSKWCRDDVPRRCERNVRCMQ